MQDTPTGQPNALAIAILGPNLGKHSRPSFSAIPLGVFGGGTLAIIARVYHLPAVLIVPVALIVLLLLIRLTPSRPQQQQ